MPRSTLNARIFERALAMNLAKELPELSGLPYQRLDQIRAGDALSAHEYEQLCRALAVDPSTMYRGQEIRPNRIPARFRAALVLDHPNGHDIRILALAVEQGRILAHLKQMLGAPVRLATHRSVCAPEAAREPWREGYELGERARTALCPQPGPILDLFKLLKALGIHVAHVELSTQEIDAASLWEPSAVPVLLLNKKSRRYDSAGAVRATLAHELCHLLHDAGEQDLTTQISWRADGDNYSNTVEVRARAFAPAFLAPRVQVTAWFETLPSGVRHDPERIAVAMGEHWGLSFEGAAWHAKNCGLVKASVAQKLASHGSPPHLDLSGFFDTKNWSVPAMVNQALPEAAAEIWDGTAAEVVLQAFEEGHLTLGRARELLTWS